MGVVHNDALVCSARRTGIHQPPTVLKSMELVADANASEDASSAAVFIILSVCVGRC
jgi:hypothetical protein